jgi:neutral ceramidase
MNNTNTLISGDNKGAAAQFMERWAAAQAAQAEEAQQQQLSKQAQQRQQGGSGGGGQGVAAGGLVAAFCQANVGDTSPNTQGAFCADTGQPCDAVHSTCGGRVQQCIGRGPGWPDNFASTRIIGQAQADKAQELLMGGGESPPTHSPNI